MRSPDDMPRRRPRVGRGRAVVLVTAAVLVVLFLSLRSLATFWTDYLWFDSLGLSDVWSTTLLAKLQLGLLFTAVFFVGLYVNLLVADRHAPRFGPRGTEDELLDRYHEVIDRRAGTFRLVVAATFAVITGAGVSSQWQEWLLFRDGGQFGVADPNFDVDVGFYVFRLPFLMGLVDWLFAALLIVLLITGVAYYLNGGIRVQAPGERATPQVKAHLSVLLALLALVRAGDYWLQRYMLSFSERSGVVSGVTATAANAELPALNLLLIISLGATALFIVNIRRRGWALPLVAVGIWALVQLIVGEAYPAVYQRFVVQPDESRLEQQAIANNIEATRASYDLQAVSTTEFGVSASVDDASRSVTDNPEIIRNIQLLDPNIVNPVFQLKQSVVAPYAFAGVSTDRYPMTTPSGDTAMTQVVISTREIEPEQIPQRTWEALRLSYTHGYGYALSAGNAVTTSGTPDFAVFDVPMVADGIEQPVTEPQVYFGERIPEYSVVGTTQGERDPGTADQAGVSYAGSGGVALDSAVKRAAFAARFGDLNLLISNAITPESRLLFNREIRNRVRTVAPFLTVDSDPYPVAAGNRLVYVVDAYTTSSFYPNAQPYQPLSPWGELGRRQVNYVRDSVKVVLDTYDGTMSFYVVDESDPVIEAWSRAFPTLFKGLEQAPQALREHWRYPQDIFQVQTDMWGRYHIDDPNAFYNRTDAWEAPARPLVEVPNSATRAEQLTQAVTPTGTKGERMRPYYVMNKLPGDEKVNFMLVRPFQPFSNDDSKRKLTSFMVAKSDADGPYGKLQVYTVPAEAVDGPGIVNPTILADPAVAGLITVLNQQGSTVSFGDLIMVPLEESFLWVRTMYVESSEQGAPLVSRVIAVFRDRVVMANSLEDALRELLPGSRPETFEGAIDTQGIPPPPDGDGGGTTTTTAPPGTTPTTSEPVGDADVAQLVAQANDLLEEAQAAYDRRDLNTYLAKVDEAAELLRRAEELSATQAPAPSSESPTTEVPPTEVPPGTAPGP